MCLSSGYYDAYYGRAQKVRTLIRRDFENAFQKVDAIVSPVAPRPARKIGSFAGDPLHEYLSDIFTISANLAGIPGISVPCGTTDFDGDFRSSARTSTKPNSRSDLSARQILGPHLGEARRSPT
jgi:aspartyl-tRNA(Asn)/glutamyl-tRNA(Gln) amidotransferase subunit A